MADYFDPPRYTVEASATMAQPTILMSRNERPPFPLDPAIARALANALLLHAEQVEIMITHPRRKAIGPRFTFIRDGQGYHSPPQPPVVPVWEREIT